jgi:hypothetical protein
MTMMPPIRASHTWTSFANACRTVFSKIPRRAKTTENPKTKNRLLRKICFCFDRVSARETPARYVKNVGMIGSIHGDKNETSPAMNATIIVISTIF